MGGSAGYVGNGSATSFIDLMTRLEELLLASGKITAEDLRKVQRLQGERGELLEKLLIELGFISEDDLLPILGEYYIFRW